MRRPWNFQPDRCYHLTSRVANHAYYFSGDRLSVAGERLDAIKRRRWAEVEQDLTLHVPRLLSRGSNRVARDILAILASGPRRPAELREELGISSANYFRARYLAPMEAAGLIKQSGSKSPYAPSKTYSVTQKGKRSIVCT